MVVNGQLDAADDWIVDHVDKNDIVITGDIPLAARCLKKGARVLEPKGLRFHGELYRQCAGNPRFNDSSA